jgi:hypothetical protein
VIDEYGAIVELYWQGKTEELGEKPSPRATLSTRNPTWIDSGANPGLRGERPATNRLNHGTPTRLYEVKIVTVIEENMLNSC